MKQLERILGITAICCLFLFSAMPADAQRRQSGRTTQSTAKSSDGQQAVDLGLSVKWADRNVGAKSPEGYGDYLAWGDTRSKSTYLKDNCKTFGKSVRKTAGNAQYDAATARWGSKWRTPTKEEFEELCNKCEWEWTTQNGVNGMKVTGPNGNSIFLPASGARCEQSIVGPNSTSKKLMDVGEEGHYWCSDAPAVFPGDPYPNFTAWESSFRKSSYAHVGYFMRYYGQSIRPVCN